MMMRGMKLGRLFVLVALVAYGWWVTSLEAFSVAATVAVVGSGCVAVVAGLAWRRRHASAHAVPTPIETRGVSGWGAIAVAVVAWQVAAYLQAPRSEHPTVSSITNTMLDAHAVRALAFAIWLFLAARLAAMKA
jgi:hypothetical protein